MRGWMVAVACSGMTGCVVYRGIDDTTSTWTSTSSGTSWEDPEGQVEVGWRIGSAGCEVSGIETVEIDLRGFVNAFDCADESATITAAVGRHPLKVTGFDGNGTARYAGDGGTVRIRSGELTIAPTVVLSGLPATIEATWYFENGQLCVPNGVRDVEVDLFDGEDTLQATGTADCDQGRVRIEDVEAGVYTLVVLGRDPKGDVVYSGEQLVDAGRGDDVDLEVVLSPEQ